MLLIRERCAAFFIAMDDLLALTAQFRTALLRRERQASRALLAAYADVWRNVRDELRRLTDQIAAAQDAGETVNTSWLYREQRLQTLQDGVTQRLAAFGDFAEQQITAAQVDALQLAMVHSEALIQAAFGVLPPRGIGFTFVAVPDDALVALVGSLTDGSPLRTLLQSLVPDAAATVQRILVTGLATGQGPRQIARQLRDLMGGGLTRALRISRTETLRAYRTAALANYQRNSDVVQEWVWSAQLSTRTCAMCWAMHGTVHQLAEPFASHVNCRCVPMPRTRSWADLGFTNIPDTRPVIRPGVEAFADLPEVDQRQILGPGKFALYAAGQLRLGQLVGERTDPRWGDHRYERSLQSVGGTA